MSDTAELIEDSPRALERADLVQRVRDLLPLIRDNAEKCEAEKRPADEVVLALEEAGIFKAFVPRRFGGYEIDVATLLDITVTIAEGCMSTAWVSNFWMSHNYMLCHFPPETLQKIYAKQAFTKCPVTNSPTGKAHPVEGGYRVSGRWPWGTGITHADWVILHCVPQDDTGPMLVLIPAEQVVSANNWACVGMVGTGSHDIIVEDVFVPHEHCEPIAGIWVGRSRGANWLDSPTYRLPMLPMLTLTAAMPALGGARRALELYRERLERRVYGSENKYGDRQASQIMLGDLTVRVQIAETLYRALAARVDAIAHSGEPAGDEERAQIRLTVGHAARMCRDIIRDILEVNGASAYLDPNPLQRIFRDVHALMGHMVFDPSVTAENYGCLLLGMEAPSLN